MAGPGAAAGATAPPPNDDFANAQPLTGSLPLAITGTTVGATSEAGEPTGKELTPSGHSVWFRWVPTSTGAVTLALCNSEQRVNVGVYVGATLTGLAEVTSSRYYESGFCEMAERRISFKAHAGVVYWFQVEGDGWASQFLPLHTSEAPFEIQFERPKPPANDNFAAAEPFSPESPGWRGSRRWESLPAENFGATRQPGEPYLQSDPGGASIWFKWTAPRNGGVWVGGCTDGSVGSPIIGVFTGSTVDALTAVPEIEPQLDPCSYAFFAAAGVTYEIALDGRYDPASDSASMFATTVSIGYGPEDDNFENAVKMGDPTAGWTVMGFSNVGATKQPGEPDHYGNPGGASVWLSWTSPKTGSMQVSLCEPTFNALIGIYTGSSVDALTPVTSGLGPAGQGCSHDKDMTGEVGFNVLAGGTYYMAVDGVDGATGHFNLEWAWNDELLKPAAPVPPPSGVPAAPAGPVALGARIKSRKIDRRGRVATFRLASQSGSGFRCKLDTGRFSPCGSKVTYRRLAPGRHTFRAEAVAADGAVDGAPAKATFRIARRTAHPARR